MARQGVVTLNLRLPERLWAELTARTYTSGVSLNETIIRALEFSCDATGRIPTDDIDMVLHTRNLLKTEPA